MFQVGTQDIVGRPVADWIEQLPPPANAPALGLADDLVPGVAPRHAVQGRRRDGSRFLLDVSRVDLGSGAARVGMCVMRDLSETERIAAMQRQFVTMVSHELRTPLTSLRGSLDLLTDGTMGEFAPDVRKLLRLAHENAERLVRLVNDILDFEKLRAGALRIELEDADLAAIASQAVEAVEGMARQSGVTLQLHVALREYPVRADPVRIMQVLANLPSNAIKHSPPHRSVDVRLQRLTERVRLSVVDLGPGVPPDFVARLFEPFQQANDRAPGGKAAPAWGWPSAAASWR